MRAFASSLAARTMLVLFLGIGAVHLLSLWTYRHALDREVATADVTRLADRLLTIRRAVMRVVPAEREAVAHDLSGGPIDVHWSRSEHTVAGGPGSGELAGLAERLATLGDDLAPGDVVVGANRDRHDDPHLAVVSLALPDRTWINFSLVEQASRHEDGHGTLLSTSLMALGAMVLSILMVRWLTRPLLGFVDAARRIYRGGETVAVPEDGPTEIRTLAVAFNEMQRRIKRMIDDRTHALAAVSHDLRTPITRLRLRAENVEDPQERARFLADLDQMDGLVQSALAHLRDGRSDEPMTAVDLTSLAQTVADHFADMGHDLPVASAERLAVRGRPSELERALTNLADNACKYGRAPRIALTREADQAVLAVIDTGPGIPPERRAELTEPFVRGDAARTMNQRDGFGLGLTIARTIAEAHGGRLEFLDRPAGEFSARLVLPLNSPKASSPANNPAPRLP